MFFERVQQFGRFDFTISLSNLRFFSPEKENVFILSENWLAS